MKCMALAALLLLGACNDYGLHHNGDVGPMLQPVLEVTPAALDFARVRPPEVGTRRVQVRSVGSDRLRIEDLSIEGSGAFALEHAAELPLGLDPGDSLDLLVRFAPSDPEAHGATLVVNSDDPEALEVPVPLVGQGVSPWLRVVPEDLDFGEVEVPCEVEETLTLFNDGNDDLALDGVDYESDGQLTLLGAEALPASLGPGEQAQVTVRFAPHASGPTQGTLVATSDDPRGEVEAMQVGEGRVLGEATDHFTALEDPPVDILFAVDQSGSMDDDSARLAANFDLFIGEIAAVTDGWQVGVVTLDHGCLNGGVLSPETEDVDAAFTEAVVLGEDTEVEDDEALFQLVDRALALTAPGACNEGFLREQAPLHVIVVSDEPERSPEEAASWTWSWFQPRFEGHLDAGTQLLVSGVIDLSTCNEGAAGYAEMIDATGGEALDICASDWASYAVDLATASLVRLWSFPLSDTPAQGTLEVWVDGEPAPGGWTWDEVANAVVFDSLWPGTEVVVAYELAGECTG